MQLPLFTLPVCLLPGGFMKLRIFEPRYHRLVAESLKSGQGFGVGMLNQTHNELMPIGTQVRIVDFESLEDGTLGITIEAMQRFKIMHTQTEADGLQIADIELLPNWPQAHLDADDYLIQVTLAKLFETQAMEPYPTADFDDISWLCQRWLEILPLTTLEKLPCINPPNHLKALELIRELFS